MARVDYFSFVLLLLVFWLHNDVFNVILTLILKSVYQNQSNP
jgi:hypothetical protein